MTEKLIAIKQPLGAEDILLGSGTVTQTRFGVEITLTKVNAAVLPYEDDANMESIKTKLDKKLEVPAGETVLTVVIGDNDSAGTGFRTLKLPNV